MHLAVPEHRMAPVCLCIHPVVTVSSEIISKFQIPSSAEAIYGNSLLVDFCQLQPCISDFETYHGFASHG